MIVNNEMEIKFFYRLVEYVSKMKKIDLPHERAKLIILDNYKAETKAELEVKSFAEAYLYIINNKNQILSTTIIKRAYYLLTGKMLREAKIKNILETYYRNYDESSHYLAALMHLEVLKNVRTRKIEFAFMITNLVMLKKKRNVVIPYEYVYKPYFKAIKEKNIDKLMYIYMEMEATNKPFKASPTLNKEKIIKTIEENVSVIKNKYGVKKLYLYGSYAKEKTSLTSDVDLLIIFNENVTNYKKNQNAEILKEYLSEKLNQTVDLLDFTHAMENLDLREMENITTLI